MSALVTGSSSGIGLAIASMLLDNGTPVIGLSRQPGPLQAHPHFAHWPTDLTDLTATISRARRFRQEQGSCSILVLAAGAGAFSPTDSQSADEISYLVTLNLTSPMALCSHMLPSLRQSASALVVCVGSTSARERSALGATYAATKAGLQSFSESLFMENRKLGIRVMYLAPGMTATNFYQHERFEPDPSEQTALSAKDLAATVFFFYQGPGQHLNPTNLVLEPQRVRIRKKPLPPPLA